MTASPWQYFTQEELACKCCGQSLMHPEFMPKIVILRRELGFPFPVTSAYRCAVHNQEVSKTGLNGPHTTGRAIDLGVSYQQAIELLKAAIFSDMFTGIGINQKGSHRFIHLDDIPGPDRLWTY